MPSIVDCPSCSRKVRIPEELAGTKVQCPTCGSMFAAGNGPPAEPSPAWEEPPSRPLGGPRRAAGDDDRVVLSRAGGGRRHLQAHRGPLILVLGILSVVPHGLHLILGPIAWILGNNDLKEIQAGRMDPEGEGMTNAGRICGMIGTILGLVGLVAVFVMVLLFCLVPAIFFTAAGPPKSSPPPPARPPARRMEAPVWPGAWWPPPPQALVLVPGARP
jgi:hypothetical protein